MLNWCQGICNWEMAEEVTQIRFYCTTSLRIRIGIWDETSSTHILWCSPGLTHLLPSGVGDTNGCCRLCSPHLISVQNGRKCGEEPESDSPNVELFQYIVGFESLPQGSCSTVVKTIVGNIQHLEEYVCL